MSLLADCFPLPLWMCRAVSFKRRRGVAVAILARLSCQGLSDAFNHCLQNVLCDFDQESNRVAHRVQICFSVTPPRPARVSARVRWHLSPLDRALS